MLLEEKKEKFQGFLVFDFALPSKSKTQKSREDLFYFKF